MAAPSGHPLLPRPEGHSDFSPRAFPSVAWLPLCLLVVSIFTTASTGALLMQNFRLGQPPLVNEGDLVPAALDLETSLGAGQRLVVLAGAFRDFAGPRGGALFSTAGAMGFARRGPTYCPRPR
jgi:hypothetical protein